mgnify:FL=1
MITKKNKEEIHCYTNQLVSQLMYHASQLHEKGQDYEKLVSSILNLVRIYEKRIEKLSGL